MKLSKLVIAAAVVAAGATSLSTSALAQAKEQFFPLLSYRTGPYAPNGPPWAHGQQDYIKTSKPESMSREEFCRLVAWERENMN